MYERKLTMGDSGQYVEKAKTVNQYITHAHSSNSKKNDHQQSNWIIIDEEKECRGSKVSDKAVRNFLQGAGCTWSLAFSDRIVVRHDIINRMVDFAETGGITALIGAGGEGKSTVLMQTCAQLYRNKRIVLYHRDVSSFKLPSDIKSDAILVVDNPPNTKAFKEFLSIAIEDELTMIIGSRGNEWNLLKDSLDVSNRSLREYVMPQITKLEEAEQFAACVEHNMTLSRSHKEIVDMFLHNAYGFLYASMLMLIHNATSLDDIAENIINKLSTNSPKALLLLAHIVLSENLGIPFSLNQYRKTCQQVGIAMGKAKNFLALETKQSGNIYETRHKAISELFYEYCFSNQGVLLIEQIDDVLTFFILYHLQLFENAYAGFKSTCKSNLIKCASFIPEASDEAQKYMFNLIIDSCKNDVSFLNQIARHIENIGTKRCFLKLCYEREIFDPQLLLKMARVETQADHIGFYDHSYCARQIFSKACMEFEGFDIIWLAWAKLEWMQRNIGNLIDPAPNTARWIFREACINHNANDSVWMAWGKLEQEQNNIGDLFNPGVNTARWIFYKACINHNANDNVWMAWARFEKKQNNTGDFIDPAPNTARWIFRKSCTTRKSKEHVWKSWAKLEQELNNWGDFENPEQYATRWIYRKAFMEYGIIGENLLNAWAQFEKNNGMVGDFENPEQYSTRWIYRKACIDYRVNGEHLLNSWVQFEKNNGMVGDFEHPEQYTARWILREICCKRNVKTTIIWKNWAKLEVEKGNIGDHDHPSQNTARWIYHQACLNQEFDEHNWTAWAKLERELGNDGDFINPLPKTARWIYRKACVEHNFVANHAWLDWACMEKEGENIGELNNPSPNTARWIFRKACIEFFVNDVMWMQWARFEKRQNNIGCKTEPYTAIWILENGIERCPHFSWLCNEYALLVLQYHGDIVQAERLLKRSLEHSDSALPCLAILEILLGNIMGDDNYCAYHLMEKMKLSINHSVAAIQGLLECYKLLENEDEAKYYENLLQNSEGFDHKDEELVNEYLIAFGNYCKEAIYKAGV